MKGRGGTLWFGLLTHTDQKLYSTGGREANSVSLQGTGKDPLLLQGGLKEKAVFLPQG